MVNEVNWASKRDWSCVQYQSESFQAFDEKGTKYDDIVWKELRY